MPKVSSRGQAMPPSPIRKLVPYAEKAMRKGKKIYHLNIGQPDIATPDISLDAIKNFDLKVIEYSHTAGFESYRNKLVGYYSNNSIQLNNSQIIVTTGGSEALLIGMLCSLEAGDEIIIPEPFYANYNGFACAAGVIVKPITATIENGFALPPIEEFGKVITEKTKAILICNPNNPTGYLYSREELEALREIVLKHNLFLFSDEVYREFCYEGAEHFSVMQLEGLDEHVIMVDSISKRYSACGARVGALVSKNKDVIDCGIRFAQARLSPPTLGQIVGEAAIDTPMSYFEEVKSEYLRRRNLIIESLNNMNGVTCPTPGGAFYAVAKLPVDDTDKFCQWLLESFSHNDQTVMLAPLSGFYATEGLGKDEVRIAYVLNVDDLKNAMECLEIALTEYPGRKEIEQLEVNEQAR
ncbi:MAG: aspartate aminotransferase [Bacteroidetes bacterium]|nr:MAG: aspartate aminotransferase [Bacteroidota bacterium]